MEGRSAIAELLYMFQVLYYIFITPIENIIEMIFFTMHKLFMQEPAISIMFVSLFVNVLILPLYKRADEMQEKERDKQKAMEPWLTHIRKTFKGDERYMMTNTYYRIEGYKPLYSITGSLSLLFQIPFFIAAYHFLSNLTLLSGMSFLMINDLGSPDGILKIGSISVNLLPILMTAINILSGMIYTKGFKLRDKLQLYGMALIFLILLYKSPSALVLYWTCNNLFSLGKNIFFKYVKNRKLGVGILSCVTGTAIFIGIVASHRITFRKQLVLFLGLMIVSYIPIILYFCSKYKLSIKDKISALFQTKSENEKVFTQNFWLGSLLLTAFMGFLIPTSLIVLSPVEFGTISVKGPLELVVYSVFTYLGTFIVWIGIFYLISRKGLKNVFTYLIFAVSAVALLDYYVFFGNFGIMTYNLQFEKTPIYSKVSMGINALAVFTLVALCIFIMKKWPKLVRSLYQILLIMMVILGVVNVVKIQSQLVEENYYEHKGEDTITPTVPLSKNGKNVVVIMMDRAISAYLPYIFNEKPELAKKYEDFVYYPNTVTYGSHTNYGSPGIYGGYEYTPLEMNKRADESIVDKHNESLKVLPKIFADNGYTVSVCDPPLANYQEVPDISIFDGMDGITAHITTNYWGEYGEMKNSSAQKRNIFFYSIFRTIPVVMQSTIYDDGNYLGGGEGYERLPYCAEEYAFLNGIDRYTYVDENVDCAFFELSSMLTHRPTYLETQGYTLNRISNNEIDYSQFKDKYTVDGETLKMEEDMQIQHYHVNMATYLILGRWIDYLKKEGVYDNTRIVIVSDHGYELWQLDKTIFSDDFDAMYYNPILFVKDFADSNVLEPEEYTYITNTRIKMSNEFMTNADVPSILMKGVIDNPVNPYTGNPINDDAKKEGYPIITTSHHNHEVNSIGNIMDTSDGKWYEIRGNVLDKDCWVEVNPE